MILLVCILTISDYYSFEGIEGTSASLNCDGEAEYPGNPYIVIDEVKYTLESFNDCLHNYTYGVKNKCDNETTCDFTISNELVGSSCGTGGNAWLTIRYHCVRKFNTLFITWFTGSIAEDKIKITLYNFS